MNSVILKQPAEHRSRQWIRRCSRIPRVLLLWYAVGVIGLAASACSTATAVPSKDASRTLCLFPDQQPRLISAAVTLGLAERGTIANALQVANHDLTVDEWRVGHRDDFDRACDTMISATQLPQAPLERPTAAAASVWTVLLPVLVGALITWLTTGWRDSTARWRQQADALRAANRTFGRTSQTYVRQWIDPTQNRPTDQYLRDSRHELIAELHEVAAARPRWTVPPRLLRLLSDGPLGDQLARTWPGMEGEPLASAAHEVQAQLSALDITINRVARALEQPGRRHRAMRAPEPTSTGRQTTA